MMPISKCLDRFTLRTKILGRGPVEIVRIGSQHWQNAHLWDVYLKVHHWRWARLAMNRLTRRIIPQSRVEAPGSGIIRTVKNMFFDSLVGR